jgi:small subunit ribosomal protein S6
MAKDAPIYDLTLLLSAEAEDDQRSKILSDVESAISTAGGSVERNDDWGRRPLAYEIRHRPDAEYHLLQFRAPPTLIEELSHTLRITDGVLRFRVIKNRPGTPPAPSSPPPVVVAATSHAPATAAAPAPATSSAPDEPATAAAPAPATSSAPDEPAASDAPAPNATATAPAEPEASPREEPTEPEPGAEADEG